MLFLGHLLLNLPLYLHLRLTVFQLGVMISGTHWNLLLLFFYSVCYFKQTSPFQIVNYVPAYIEVSQPILVPVKIIFLFSLYINNTGRAIGNYHL